MFRYELPQTIELSSKKELEDMLDQFEQGRFPDGIAKIFTSLGSFENLLGLQKIDGEKPINENNLESEQNTEFFIISLQPRPREPADKENFALVTALPDIDISELNVIHIELPFFTYDEPRQDWSFLQRFYSLQAKENFPYQGLHFGYLLPFVDTEQYRFLNGLVCDLFYMFPFFHGDMSYFNQVKSIKTLEINNRKMLLNCLQYPGKLPIENISYLAADKTEELNNKHGARLIACWYFEDYPGIDYLHRFCQQRSKSVCWNDLNFCQLIANGLNVLSDWLNAKNASIFHSFLTEELYDPRSINLIGLF